MIKLITIHFGTAIGYGGYSWLWGYNWCVWKRIYIKGIWTPFCIIKVHLFN